MRLNDKTFPPSLSPFSSSLPLILSFFIVCSQIDGDICLFMNTEVTCNQPERAQASGLLVPHLSRGPARRIGEGEEKESDRCTKEEVIV